MSSTGGGYLNFDSPPLKSQPYLDGYSLFPGFDPSSFSAVPGSGVFLLPNHAGGTIIQKPFIGALSVEERSPMTFSFSMLADDEESYYRIKRARARGAAVYFCPFLWIEEVVNAASGSDYGLSRYVAWGIVSGVTSVTHPAIFHLNGAVDAAAASLSGKTLSALKDGEIAVRYLPVFKVVVTSMPESVGTVNQLTYSVELSEVIEA